MKLAGRADHEPGGRLGLAWCVMLASLIGFSACGTASADGSTLPTVDGGAPSSPPSPSPPADANGTLSASIADASYSQDTGDRESTTVSNQGDGMPGQGHDGAPGPDPLADARSNDCIDASTVGPDALYWIGRYDPPFDWQWRIEKIAR